MDFNLQTFLSEMRAEQREDHTTVLGKIEALDRKVDGVVATQYHHETRLVIVENTRRTIRWLAGTVIVALVGGILDFFFVHLPKLLRH